MRLKEIFQKATKAVKEKTVTPLRRAYLTWRMLEACEIDAFDDVPELIERGANIHAEDDIALAQASRGCFPVVKLLVEKGAEIRAGGDRALRTAASHGQLKIVKYLHTKGANLNAGNGEALIFAAEHGHLEVVRYLTDNGVAIHSADDWAYRGAVHNQKENVIAYFDKFLEQKNTKTARQPHKRPSSKP
ncbi:MAG: ankyrin repeat domain-containing protein [Alphaproteobacteria bacterium]|nr:MAG: ankyrin repeat domain-containing protein [Alphaproteobacteria bacterium]